MSNGGANCILGVCCPPRSAAQKATLAKEIAKHLGSDVSAEKVADWILETYDLAPAGSLVEFKAEIAKLARENPSA